MGSDRIRGGRVADQDAMKTKQHSLQQRYGTPSGEGVKHAAYLKEQVHEHAAAERESQRARHAAEVADRRDHELEELRGRLVDAEQTYTREVLERLNGLCRQAGVQTAGSQSWGEAAEVLQHAVLRMVAAHAQQESYIAEITHELEQQLARVLFLA